MLPGWTAVIVNYNGAGFIEACLAALAQTRVQPHDIIVVDNASTDDSLQDVHAYPRANVLALPRNLGFAAGANVGLRAVETELALLLNPDVEVGTGFGNALIAAFSEHPRLGAVGALLLYPDGKTIQHAGGAIERPLMTTRHLRYGSAVDGSQTPAMAVEFVTGGAMGLRMTAFHAVGGFDERFSPVYYEDVDLCLRLRELGWNVRFDPSLRALHHEGVTLQRSSAYFRHLHRNRIRFALKHLSASEWRDAFVPAECKRLRHELWTLQGDAWGERSGADALEAVLRGSETDARWSSGPAFPGPSPSALASHVDELREAWEVIPASLRTRHALLHRIQRWARRGGTEAVLEESFERQRAFNAAVVRALEVQDQLNREQTAALFLLSIDAIGRLHQAEPETAAPQSE